MGPWSAWPSDFLLKAWLPAWPLQGIATARLPIGEFMKLASSQVSQKSLPYWSWRRAWPLAARHATARAVGGKDPGHGCHSCFALDVGWFVEHPRTSCLAKPRLMICQPPGAPCPLPPARLLAGLASRWERKQGALGCLPACLIR
jgi:hypothetical protein